MLTLPKLEVTVLAVCICNYMHISLWCLYNKLGFRSSCLIGRGGKAKPHQVRTSLSLLEDLNWPQALPVSWRLQYRRSLFASTFETPEDHFAILGLLSGCPSTITQLLLK